MINRWEDHRSAGYRPPSGCRHCGIGEYVHAQRWTSGAGRHGYALPTLEQVRARMLELRRAYTSRAETP